MLNTIVTPVTGLDRRQKATLARRVMNQNNVRFNVKVFNGLRGLKDEDLNACHDPQTFNTHLHLIAYLDI